MVRLAIVMPTLCAAIAAVLMSGHPLWAGAIGLLALGSAFRSPALKMTARVESLVALTVFGVAGLIAVSLAPTVDLLGYPAFGVPWRALVLFGLLMSLLRLHMKSPWGGRITTTGVSLLCMLGLGAGRDHPLYPWVLVLYGLTLWMSSRLLDPTRPRWAQLGWGPIGVAGVSVLGTLAAGYGVALVLPPVHDRTLDYAVQALSLAESERRSGFSSNLQLGAMKSMLQSDEKVLRLEGPAPDHLRGVVYTTYRFGRWFAGASAAPAPAPSHPAGAGATRVQVLSPQQGLVFVPLQGGEVGSEQELAVNDYGVFRGQRPEVEHYWFDLEASNRAQVSPPDEDDLRVPARMQQELRRVAQTVTSSAVSVRTQLHQLVGFFHEEFEYSLSFERPSGGDPVLHFLSEGRQGHCEYFASAMTLLARSQGISARVVGGYLVVERSPLTKKVIVRDKHAHAWVEAWVDGRWVTFDPTPPAGLAATMGSETPILEAYVDWVADRLGGVLRILQAYLPWICAGILVGAGLYLGIPRLRARRPRSPLVVGTHPVQGPKDYMAPLLHDLGLLGLVRASGETLEGFASRVRGSAIPENIRLSEVLLSYAALRYGGLGDEAGLIQSIAELRSRQVDEPG